MLFHPAGSVFTILTLQSPIGTAEETLRIFGVQKFPMYQYNTRGKEQTPAEKVSDKQHGRKHHEMSPVINPAVHTAFIFHDKGLKGAKKQNQKENSMKS